MANARSIINAAARKINVVGRGQTMPADEAQDALEALNDLLGSFSAETGVIYNDTKETFTLTSAASYTIGVGGDFNTATPIEITNAYVSVGSIDYVLNQVNADEYLGISNKNISGIPESFYFDASTPLGEINLFPKPAAAYTLTLVSRKAITEFADLTTEYDLPPGFRDMLVYNLAVKLSPEYEKPVSQDILAEARRTKTAMKGFVSRNNYPTSEVDIKGVRSGNIYSGWEN